MKTQSILVFIGGFLLITSTFIPAHNTNMWGALKVIDRYFMVGALPLVMSITGLVGIVTGLMKKNLIPLICGAFAFVWMVVACRFQIYFLLREIFFATALIGSVIMIIAGILGLTTQTDKKDLLDN